MTQFYNIDVVHVLGITDIDSKIIQRAEEEGIEFYKLTKKYETEFFRDIESMQVNQWLTLILLVPFSYKLMHHLKPFAIVVLNGEITVYTVLIPQMVLNGRSANTKPSLDTSKWWINGPSKTIWMVVQLATNTVQMVSPCVCKHNGHFWKWKFSNTTHPCLYTQSLSLIGHVVLKILHLEIMNFKGMSRDH